MKLIRRWRRAERSTCIVGAALGAPALRSAAISSGTGAAVSRLWRNWPNGGKTCQSRIWPHTPETQRQMEFILNWDDSLFPWERARVRMNWHARYTQQANWTRELRKHIFERTGIKTAERVLEVGCGTGAILSEIQTQSLHGLDIQPATLMKRESMPQPHP